MENLMVCALKKIGLMEENPLTKREVFEIESEKVRKAAEKIFKKEGKERESLGELWKKWNDAEEFRKKVENIYDRCLLKSVPASEIDEYFSSAFPHTKYPDYHQKIERPRK